jgi:hypothetical protein
VFRLDGALYPVCLKLQRSSKESKSQFLARTGFDAARTTLLLWREWLSSVKTLQGVYEYIVTEAATPFAIMRRNKDILKSQHLYTTALEKLHCNHRQQLSTRKK